MTSLTNTLAIRENTIQDKQKNVLTFSDVSFENFRKYIYDNCGIYFQDNKKYLLESRLQKRITYLNMESYDEYLNFLKTHPGSSNEKKYLYEAITINETFFFRNQPQLDALASTVLPELIISKRKAGRPKIKIWSAASSSGEEAYSIGIIIADLIKPKFPDVEFEIVGTDINHAVIETAKEGKFKEYSIRNTPVYYIKKYFITQGNNYEIKPEIKKMVSFKVSNLFDDLSMKSMSGFDLIFCANVLIYFDLKSKIRVVSNLYNSLNKGGYFFIGYAETLHMISKAFALVSFPKTIGYKKE